MNSANPICPVCTLYLRPGITLKQHLASHPKQKVIEALVRLAGTDGDVIKLDDSDSPTTPEPSPSTSTDPIVTTQTWNTQNPTPSSLTSIQGNHVYIYQQCMSTTAPPNQNVLNINPLSPQYVIPTVFNPQMMPYVYQQQQVIMASNCPTGLRPLPFQMPQNEPAPILDITETSEQVKEIEEPKEEDEESKKTPEIEVKDAPLPQEQCENDAQPPEAQPEPASNWNLELKSCQTQTTTTESPVEDIEYSEDRPEYFYVNEDAEIGYTNSNILQPVSEQQQEMDMMEMENMHAILIKDLSSNQIIAEENSRPAVLMTIGDVSERHIEDSTSRGSLNVNIRTDECMPARGELSGQESIGGSSDINWNRVQSNEGSSGLGGSHDLLAWNECDTSDSEDLPSNSQMIVKADVHPSATSLQYKCASCDETFSNCIERRDHELEHHPEKTESMSSGIGSQFGKKKVKKLTIKPKSVDTEKPETSELFVFGKNLKMENLKTEQTENPNAINTVEPVLNEDGPIELKTVCPICDCMMANARALKLHQFQVHKISKEIRHKCGICSEGFQYEYKYTQHLQIHPLECRMCGKQFHRRQNMDLHMRRHLGVRPYKCDLCNKAFVTKQKHDEHRNSHTGEAPIKCDMCEETFRRHSNLVQHRNRHHLNLKKTVKDYVCVCGEVFHSKKKLAWHKETHDRKPKSCTQCTEKFVHSSSLTRHMRRAHNQSYLPNKDRSNENVPCPICKGTYLRSSLEAHIKTHSGERPYACEICNKSFTTKWNLKLHKWTHASRASKPYKCDQCKAAFIRESDYTAHVNAHKSVRPYTCNYCGEKFIRKSNCVRHVKEHENEKTFNCEICNKTFHRSYYLKDHMKVHSGERPFSCHICGKTSSTKSNHNKHLQIHHAREQVNTEN